MQEFRRGFCGNSRPTTSTVAHPGPWLTTVAAGTHNRDGQGSVTLGNGVTYAGASVAPEGPRPLIVRRPPACPEPTRRARTVLRRRRQRRNAGARSRQGGGQDRRVRPRRKCARQQEPGGAGSGRPGMIWSRPAPTRSTPTSISCPRFICRNTDRTAVKAYAATAGATATINPATIVYNAMAPFTASFSSRGPLRAGNGDLLKPDLIPPGRTSWPAVAPAGTTAAVRHLQRHVDVEPACGRSRRAVQATPSGLVADGDQVGADDHGRRCARRDPPPNTNPLVIFRRRRHVRPNIAAGSGLVFDSGYNDWLQFICGTQPPGNVLFGEAPATPVFRSRATSTTASIAIGDLAGVPTVTRASDQRRGRVPRPYNASCDRDGRLDVSLVTPSHRSHFHPGQTKSI